MTIPNMNTLELDNHMSIIASASDAELIQLKNIAYMRKHLDVQIASNETLRLKEENRQLSVELVKAKERERFLQ